MNVNKLKQNANKRGKWVSAFKKAKFLRAADGQMSMDGQNTAGY
jgi:hypothetical protein